MAVCRIRVNFRGNNKLYVGELLESITLRAKKLYFDAVE